jgi:Holliday junction resolvasome RuvABC endonuclease subunit
MIIVAIDPGLRNLGWSLYDTRAETFLNFGCYDLLAGQPKKMHTKYAHLVKVFVDASRDVFAKADAVCIEIQMTAKFKVITTAFQCFFWDKAHLVSPKSVRHHFNISTGNYAKNKKASIAIIPTLSIPAKNKKLFESFDNKKRDDVADAMLIALYWWQVKSSEVPPTKKRRK